MRLLEQSARRFGRVTYFQCIIVISSLFKQARWQRQKIAMAFFLRPEGHHCGRRRRKCVSL